MSAAYYVSADVHFHRVYVPHKVDPIIQDIYNAQAGKYIVSLPCFVGDECDGFNEGSYICRAVMDDHGNLRRVS